jgi:hypothetical protein
MRKKVNATAKGRKAPLPQAQAADGATRYPGEEIAAVVLQILEYVGDNRAEMVSAARALGISLAQFTASAISEAVREQLDGVNQRIVDC